MQGTISHIGETRHSGAGCAMQSCILLLPERIGLPSMLRGDKFVNDPDVTKTGVQVLCTGLRAR